MPKYDANDLVGLLVAELNAGEADRYEWVLDMGCSVHMNPGRDLYIVLQEATFGKVRMANKSVPHVKGVASVRF